MVDHYPFAASPRLRLLVLLALVIVPGCRSSSPVAPDRARPTISGQVYQTLTQDAGEPPLVDVLITVRNATGQETTTLSNRGGFYRRCDDRHGAGDRGERGIRDAPIIV